MKTLNVEILQNQQEKSIEEISAYLDRNLTFQYIDMLPWPEQYSYKPNCKFKTVCSDSKLFIKFFVSESFLKAEFVKDMDPVWQDSCVEFFCKIPGQAHYFNFEFNCIGACLASSRTGREENVIPFTQEQFSKIERLSSLGSKPFSEKSGFYQWTLTVGLPFNLIGVDSVKELSDLQVNFYKCGDDTTKPHYLSWNNILSEKPNFHLPEYFGKLKFEDSVL